MRGEVHAGLVLHVALRKEARQPETSHYVFSPIAGIRIPVIEWAFSMSPRPPRARGIVAPPTVETVPLSALYPLSRRQAQVAGWIAYGKRNSEIGQMLGLSERTIEKHVEKIFEKLNLETRGAIGHWWHERVMVYLMTRATVDR